ncbi:MAG: SMC-Scp complex subunit ScpB [Cyanobacteria bacterium P01_F01_bin.33]
MSVTTRIEAILYLKGQPLTLSDLAALAGCARETAYDAVLELMENYAHRDSALEVLEVEDGFALQLREEFVDLVPGILPPELGVGATRTLAAIALKGTIAQAELVEIRGSGAYQHVPELVEKGFITKHRQPGNRSSLLRVTDKMKQRYEISALPDTLANSASPTDDSEQQLDLPTDSSSPAASHSSPADAASQTPDSPPAIK